MKEFVWKIEKDSDGRFVYETAKDPIDRLAYLLENFIETEDGMFAFPDGVVMKCKRKSKPHMYVYTKIGD